jgi:DNA mismatch repair protein MutS2
VVSGPNAGGKSVCLKTTGLLQMMVQSAIPVPVDDSSIFGIFNKIFIDIGDNQSIENDLSTYSSKLKNLKICLSDSDERSLFLLDEFGAGTDPQLGGYISEVALKRLLDNNAKGIVTTHYSNLKTFADQNEGMFNGAMVFDTENLSPTYKLEIGKPGSSYTFEIIKSLGFDDSFIAEAKEKLGDSSLGFDQMLIKLQQENKEAEELKNSLLDKEKQLDKLLNENKKFKQEIKQKKDEIYSQSRQKANAYLDSFNRKFEGLLKSMERS